MVTLISFNAIKFQRNRAKNHSPRENSNLFLNPFFLKIGEIYETETKNVKSILF